LSGKVYNLAHDYVAVFGDDRGIRNPTMEGQEVILRGRVLRSLLTAVILLVGAGMTIRDSSAIEMFPFNLDGNYVLSWYGDDASASPPNSTFALGGVLFLNGKREITAGSITYNDAGTVCEGAIADAGVYNILPDGQGKFTFKIVRKSGSCPIKHFVLPVAISNLGGSMFARSFSIGPGVDRAANLVGSGQAVLQADESIKLSDKSVNDAYAFSWFGHDLTSASPNNSFGAVGEIGFDQKGRILGGSITYNDGGNICSAGAVSSGGAGLSGSYSVQSGGEALINLKVVGATGTCPFTSFVMAAALSDIDDSKGTAGRIQFISTSADGSPDVVVSGFAVNVGRFKPNK
jgi:hypothetical protein